MKTLTVLGSTGSIGTNTLDVVRHNPDRYKIYALVAGQNTELLAEQIREFSPVVAVTADRVGVDRLRLKLGEMGIPRASWPELDSGAAARVRVATAPEGDVVMSAIVGVAGCPQLTRPSSWASGWGWPI